MQLSENDASRWLTPCWFNRRPVLGMSRVKKKKQGKKMDARHFWVYCETEITPHPYRAGCSCCLSAVAPTNIRMTLKFIIALERKTCCTQPGNCSSQLSPHVARLRAARHVRLHGKNNGPHRTKLLAALVTLSLSMKFHVSLLELRKIRSCVSGSFFCFSLFWKDVCRLVFLLLSYYFKCLSTRLFSFLFSSIWSWCDPTANPFPPKKNQTRKGRVHSTLCC